MPNQRILEGRHRLVVGGGIGAGKSTVTGLLAERGAAVVSADDVGHEVLRPGGGAFEQVAARWPDVVAGGRIERSVLASVVFSDAGQLAELEAMTHPVIASRLGELANDAGAKPVVVEVPVLAPLVDETWARIWVRAPLALRLERAVARGMQYTAAVQRAASQPDDEAWEAWADRVVDNDDTMALLATRVDHLVAELNRDLEHGRYGAGR